MRFKKESVLNHDSRLVFDWHGRQGAFGRLIPPWEDTVLRHESPGLGIDKRVELSVQTPLGRKLWVAEHIGFEDGKEFVDTQVEGPFASWKHRHRFERLISERCRLIDDIECALPYGLLGKVLGSGVARNRLQRCFDYRHRITAMDLNFMREFSGFGSLRVLVVGGSGFLGRHLVNFLTSQGHEVAVLSRGGKRIQNAIRWDPELGEVELPKLEGFDAFINLAGENLADGRWTEFRKRELRESRVNTTRFLVDVIRQLDKPPRVFLSGSGINYYGSDASAARNEEAKLGRGFLAELCAAWEREARLAEKAGCRVVLLRTGVVLDPRGGALGQMLPLFWKGFGGPLGSGEQWFPWIALEDWIRACACAVFRDQIEGPVNLVAPGEVQQREFAKVLGRVLRRPAFLPVPAFALRSMLGPMADEALLASVRASPEKLLRSGYQFAFAGLESGLRFMLGEQKR